MKKSKPDPAETLEGGALPAVAGEPTYTDAVGGPRPRVTFAVRRGGSVTLTPPETLKPESTEENTDAG
jgi:hypothetical protein